MYQFQSQKLAVLTTNYKIMLIVQIKRWFNFEKFQWKIISYIFHKNKSRIFHLMLHFIWSLYNLLTWYVCHFCNISDSSMALTYPIMTIPTKTKTFMSPDLFLPNLQRYRWKCCWILVYIYLKYPSAWMYRFLPAEFYSNQDVWNFFSDKKNIHGWILQFWILSDNK